MINYAKYLGQISYSEKNLGAIIMDTYSKNKKLEKIILNTNKNELFLWGNIIPIIQPFKLKTRASYGHDTLHIEFQDVEHAVYARNLLDEINKCIGQLHDARAGQDFNLELFNNSITNYPGIKFCVSAHKYEFKILELEQTAKYEST
jgi:hypothetical protein